MSKFILNPHEKNAIFQERWKEILINGLRDGKNHFYYYKICVKILSFDIKLLHLLSFIVECKADIIERKVNAINVGSLLCTIFFIRHEMQLRWERSRRNRVVKIIMSISGNCHCVQSHRSHLIRMKRTYRMQLGNDEEWHCEWLNF